MQPSTEPLADEPRFDVVVSLPSGRRLEDVGRLALEAGVRAESVEALMGALRNGPRAKIGAAVNRERAERARDQFGRAGLHVEVTPVLSLSALSTGTFDGLSVCPACSNRVKLPDSRQCPSCGVFVDKVTEEALLRRKLREKEKMALDFRLARDKAQAEEAARTALEARLREQIRKDLEKEYGIAREKQRRGKVVAIAGAVALALLAFVGGRGSSTGWSMDSLAGIVPGTGQAGAGRPDGAAGGNTAAAAAANAGPASGDPDVDDPLVQAAGGKRIGAQGISVDQAVAAAQTLARSVGYKDPGTQTATSSPGADTAAPAGPAAAGAAAGTPGAAGSPPAAEGASAASGAPVSARLRMQLALDLARLMAELGQVPRSREVLKGLRASPAAKADPASALAAQAADVEVRAWALHAVAPASRKAAVEQLATTAQAIPDALARTRSLIQAAVIVARQPDMPPELARLLLTRATEALKTLDAPVQLALMSDWSVALGETLSHEAAARARSGQWARAAELAHQIEAMIAQAPDPHAAARLHALDFHAKQLTGQTEKAAQTLAAGLALAAREADLVKRARLLQTMAALSGAGAEETMAAAADAVQAAALGKVGTERTQALSALSLLHAEAGLRGRAGEVTQLALATPKLQPGEAADLHAELLLRGDMAAARSLQGLGRYAAAEAALRRLGTLLL